MKLKEIVSGTEGGLLRISRILNNIGLAFVIILIMLGVVNVLLRRIFNYPIQGTYEMQGWALCIAVFFTWAHTQALKGNITITLVSEHLPKKFVAYCDAILYSMAVVLYAVLVWQIIVFAIRMKAAGYTSLELQAPEWTIPLVAAIGIVLFVAVLVRSVALAIADIRRGKWTP